MSTIGRSTLERACAQILPQLAADDEFILVSDGPLAPYVDSEGALPRAHEEYPQAQLIQLPRRVRDYGCTPKDVGAGLAQGDVLWFPDDDDIFRPDAIETIRKGAERHPGRFLVFRMRHDGLGRKILGGSIRRFEVGAPQLVIPNGAVRPSWRGARAVDLVSRELHAGQAPDHQFAQLAAATFGEPVFLNGLLAVIPGQNFGRQI